MKQSQQARMYQQIQQHGEQLNVIFQTGLDPVELCKKLRRIEAKASRAATAYCNGDIDSDQIDLEGEKVLNAVDKLLHFTTQKIPVFFNRDPRGYALKIKDEYTRTHNLQIHKDWGGYGIIAPEFDGRRENNENNNKR